MRVKDTLPPTKLMPQQAENWINSERTCRAKKPPLASNTTKINEVGIFSYNNNNNNNNNNNTFYSQCGLQFFSLRFSYVISDFLNISRMGIPITHVVYMLWHLGNPIFNNRQHTGWYLQ